MQPVVRTLFSRWQQQCNLMLSVLHHFVSVIIIRVERSDECQ